jgi:hypothetical protein
VRRDGWWSTMWWQTVTYIRPRPTTDSGPIWRTRCSWALPS